MPDTLDDFERSTFTLDGATRTVYRSGTGPAVIVISELPGITPNVARFARMVAGIGCTAVMPHLFGDDGRDPTLPYAAKGLFQACVSKEFATWALDRTSPVTVWLRAPEIVPPPGPVSVPKIDVVFVPNRPDMPTDACPPSTGVANT